MVSSEPSTAHIFYPLQQSNFPVAPTLVVIRTVGPPEALVQSVRRVIASETSMELVSAEPFVSFLDTALGEPRLDAILLSIFAAAALALSAVGLFGLMSATVRQRTQEIGIRTALGATPQGLVGMMTKHGLSVALIGVVFGVIGALATNQLLTALLYVVRPADMATLVAVCTILMSVALVAAFVPARAAARVDAVQAMRMDG